MPDLPSLAASGCSETGPSGWLTLGSLSRACSDTMISRHNTAVARFAHRLTLQLVEPAFYRKRSRTLPPVRLLLFGKREQFPHQLNLR